MDSIEIIIIQFEKILCATKVMQTISETLRQVLWIDNTDHILVNWCFTKQETKDKATYTFWRK